MTDTPLTPEQIKNWREILLGMIGDYALIMPVAEIQKFRDRMQRIADNLPGNKDPSCRT